MSIKKDIPIFLGVFFLLILILFIFWIVFHKPIIPVNVFSEPEKKAIYCTADVRQCPDGSFVGRVPPSCDFVECPINYSNIDVKMN